MVRPGRSVTSRRPKCTWAPKMSAAAQAVIASRPRSSRLTSTTTASPAKLGGNSSVAPVLTARRYLHHLRYFVAVGEDEHFGRAAQRLRVAQPALSRQIQDLEREIGFQLFDRLSRGVKISSAGRLF